MTRTIAVVTGTRADYGLLRWVLAEIVDRDDLRLRLIVTGSHLSAAFGSTWQAIVDDGFTIDERVDILDDDDSALGTARALARATSGIADALTRVHPDLLVVLGDRYEILGAASAALLLGIPIAHIAGGEITEGAYDDAIRHAVTKMSALHFPAAESYRARILQLGEDPAMITTVGATGFDNFERLRLFDRDELAADLGIELHERPLVVCTFHPETLGGVAPEQALDPLFQALAALPALQVIFTNANADAGGRRINELLDAYVATHADRMWAFASLGQVRYLSLLGVADAVVGNSSSGIIEAPAAGTPTVNIGARQAGRLRAPSIVDVPNETQAIEEAVKQAVSPERQRVAARRESPYGAPGAARAIVDRLATVDLAALRIKHFHQQGDDHV